MWFAGVDIGTRNLALCALDKAGRVLEWRSVDLGGPHTTYKDTLASLVSELDSFLVAVGDSLDESDEAVVWVERQPPVARAMHHGIQASVATWAELRGISWNVVQASQRGGTYKKRKARAVSYASQALDKDGQYEWTNFLHSHGKKDDLADAFIIAQRAQRSHVST